MTGSSALGAQAASSPKDVADRVETVMASLPSLQASLDVATGKGGVIEGKRVKRFIDLSTVGSQMAVKIHDLLAETNIVQIDSPVSGGVGGAEKGTLAVMVSGPRAEFERLKDALGVIGKVFFIGEKPGSGQTMKLANNFLSATAMVATSEAVVMGVKSGLDPAVMIDVINAGSGMNTASRDKFPRAVLPRSFDFGFATGLMVKDVRLCSGRDEIAGTVDGSCRSGRAALGNRDPRDGRGVRISLPRSSRSRRRRAWWSAAPRAAVTPPSSRGVGRRKCRGKWVRSTERAAAGFVLQVA